MSRRSLAYLLLLTCLSGPPAATSSPSSDPIVGEHGAIPADASPELRAAVGDYLSGDTGLTIYEVGGQLFADGANLRRAHLRRVTATTFLVDDASPRAHVVHLNFQLDRNGATAVILDKIRLPRRDIGREVVQRIQAGTKPDPDSVRRAALQAKPPSEPPPKRPADLVDLSTVDARIKLDIRYATSNNFMGFPLYEQAAALLQRPAAEALGRVQRALAMKGYGLLVFDGYRPWSVTKMFWDATPESAHVFVANPSEGSRHNRGCAVDLTLYDLKSGGEVEMTGRYDEMSRRSFADYVGGTSRQRWLRDLLRTEMERQGFIVYPEEWWHFDYQNWSDYAIGTASFAELRQK